MIVGALKLQGSQYALEGLGFSSRIARWLSAAVAQHLSFIGVIGVETLLQRLRSQAKGHATNAVFQSFQIQARQTLATKSAAISWPISFWSVVQSPFFRRPHRPPSERIPVARRPIAHRRPSRPRHLLETVGPPQSAAAAAPPVPRPSNAYGFYPAPPRSGQNTGRGGLPDLADRDTLVSRTSSGAR